MEQNTLRFFNAINDCIEKNGNKYYMLLVENENGKTLFSKMIRCNNALEMRQTLDLIRNDRLLVINYLMKNDNKYIDNFVADVHEIVKEFFNSNKVERLKTLLYNAVDLLKYHVGIDEIDVSLEDTDLLDELGMTEEEYNEIMGE